jgi:hypothetical protein
MISNIASRTLTSLLLASALGACTLSTNEPSDDLNVVTENATNAAPALCGAIKGNGPRILAHFTSLARITEEFGVLDAAAGGSSASITMFLYESMLKNRAISTCGTRPCTTTEKNERLALFLKSIHGYGEIVAQETGISKLAEEIGRVQVTKATTAVELAATVSALRNTVNANVQAILNTREILALLREKDPNILAFNVSEIRTSFAQFGNFTAPDNRIFFRVPIIDWDAATRVFGRAANFYAGEGYGPYDYAETASFLDACAPSTRGKSWVESKAVTTKNGSCGDLFQGLLLRHRDEIDAHGSPAGSHNRVDDNVGASFRAIAHSTAIVGETVRNYEKATLDYRLGKVSPTSGNVESFSPNFKDLVFGYWAGAEDSKRIANLSKDPRWSELKSAKAHAFPQRTWEYALSRSPAEPGIATMRTNEDPTAKYTVGGWGDAFPTQVLRQIGCRNVLLVTKQEKSSSSFTSNVATKLGASSQEVAQMFAYAQSSGDASQSLRNADGVWCTNWDAPGTTDVQAIATEGYNAPLLTSNPTFQSYSKAVTSERAALAGCTPGVAPRN